MTGLLWNTQGDDQQRKYDYTYDAAGRLVNAAYNERVQTGSAWSHATMDFSVTGNSGQITYDNNGNLLNMIQKGVLPGTAAPVNIDNLTYTYAYTYQNQNLSNKLSYVTDAGTAGTSNGLSGDFKDGTNAANTPDYTYDANGNLVVDLNKAIGSITGGVGTPGITYNFLDKPTQVVIAGKGTVTIVYDADGAKLQKTFTPTSGTTVTTSYVSEFIYQTTSTAPTVNTLQYINFEEGRIRVITPVAQSNTYGDALTISGNIVLPTNQGGGGGAGVYDYFVRDYQENVRMILTEEVHTGTNVCTMETANNRAQTEDAIFQGSGNEVEKTRVATTSIAGSAWHSNTSANVSQLGDYSGVYATGPNVLLKVMAGDYVNATTQYYYAAAGSYPAGTAGIATNVVTSLVGALSSGGAAGSLVKGGSGNIQTQLNGNPLFANIADPGTASGTTVSTTAPQAFLTIMFFDERFNYIGTNSQWMQVSQSGDGASPLVLPNVQAPKNGYAYVYLSNKGAQPVYFDNMQVRLAHGAIMEEDHYYAYGLKIAAISSTIIASPQEGYVTNKNLYNDKELEDDGGLNWYDYGYRDYDAQIGRFVEMDPMAVNYVFNSPYSYAISNPISFMDIYGLGPGDWIQGATDVGTVFSGSQTLANVVVTATRTFNTLAPVTVTTLKTTANLSKTLKILNLAKTVILNIDKVLKAANTGHVGTNYSVPNLNFVNNNVTCHGNNTEYQEIYKRFKKQQAFDEYKRVMATLDIAHGQVMPSIQNWDLRLLYNIIGHKRTFTGTNAGQFHLREYVDLDGYLTGSQEPMDAHYDFGPISPSGEFSGAESGIEMITASEAANFISTEEGAQSLSKVESIKDAFNKGDLYVLREPIIAVKYEGVNYILDGHHRLKAFSEIGGEGKIAVRMLTPGEAEKQFKDVMEYIKSGAFETPISH